MNRFSSFGAGPTAPVAAQNPGFQGGVVSPAGMPAGAQTSDQYGQFSTQRNRFFFTYQTPLIASLAPASSATNSILFDNDSVFEWTKMTVWGYAAATVTTSLTNSSIVVPTISLQIQDTGQGAYYSNAPIPLGVYAGAFGLPYVLPAPQFIAPNASLQFTFANEQAAGGITYGQVRVQLHGFKIKRGGPGGV